MSGRSVLVVGVALLALIALNVGLAFTAVPRILLPGIGVGMAVIVALTFMRLRAAGGLAAVFAAASVFWLCVMMGLGGMDPATRTTVPVGHGTGPSLTR